MSAMAESTFRTKLGICTIKQDRIVLTREGAVGVLSELLYGNSIMRVQFIYGLFGTIAFFCGAWMLLQGRIAGVFGCAFGVLFLGVCFTTRNVSATPVIELAAIRKVEAHPPHPPLTRGYFNVWFEERGKPRKRIIMLPGSKDGGGAEYDRAVLLLRQAGLLVNG